MHYVYGVEDYVISKFARCSIKTLRRWYKLFEETGNVAPSTTRERTARWPCEAVEWTKQYVLDHPCFYIEELQSAIRQKFRDLVDSGRMKISVTTVFRVLRFDLELSQKILVKRAREACQQEVDNFYLKLKKFYSRNDQLVFVDETAKDSRDAIRKYAWSRRGTPAIVTNKFGRSVRCSVLAAVDVSGFLAWPSDNGTYNRKKFHTAMISHILPKMNPYPFPRSILILDNAKIHMYQELIDAVQSIGAIVIFLPPYCPHLNPIEFAFSSAKKWIQKNANITFGNTKLASLILPKLFANCIPNGLVNTFRHCGYGVKNLRDDIFNLEIQ
jgi:hypothetical protein